MIGTKLTKKLLRDLGVVQDLGGQVIGGVHGPDHGADELVLQVRAGRELGQGVVLGLLLQRLAFLQPVADMLTTTN